MTEKLLMVNPVEMNRDAMLCLEDKGLIHRIAPGNDVAGPVDGDNLGRSLYESDERFGGHKLIVATIGATTLRYFGYHEDNEDVYLLGLDSWRPLYFVVATCLADEFAKKAESGTLAPADLVCLRVCYNDPDASFFVMNKYVPHGEFTLPTAADAPSFYVTESTNLKIIPSSFGSHRVEMHGDGAAVRIDYRG